MSAQFLSTPHPPFSPPPASEQAGLRGRIFTWLAGFLSFSLVAYLLLALAHQLFVAPPAQRLVLVQDIPLPSGLAKNAQDATSLAPGVDLEFDGFDFQAYDAATHRLFIAHTGPNPDDLTLNHIPFDPQYDGNVVVVDTQQRKVLARIPAPQVAGVADAADLRKVFAADAEDNIVFVINADTMQIEDQIPLQDLESPDAVSYDAVDHLIFISDPGTPPDPLKSMNTDPMNQNVAVIDALQDKVIKYVNFGATLPLLDGEQAPTTNNLPTWGYDIGHNEYDLGHDFVTVQVAANSDDPNAYVLPPPHTAEMDAIDVKTLTVDKRLQLPASCSTPHGMTIDTGQHIAFVACTDFDPATNLFENLLRVDLQTMTVIPADPSTMRLAPNSDIVRLDHTLHLLFVASSDGITIFDEKAGEFHRLSQAFIGKETHTIAINEQTHEVYFPINAGGLPVLRITRYNPNGS